MVFRRKKRFALILLAGGLLGTLCASLTSCARHPASAPVSKPTVTVVTLHPTRVSLTTELPGRVSAYRIAEVRPQVSGVLQKRLFTEGDLVKEGQQLYQVDPSPYQAAVSSAEATLAHARAAVEVSRLTVERYKALVEMHAVSRQDYDNAVATLLQAQADVGSGEAAVRTAAINLAYTKMYSPISGRTSRSSVTEGALVTANQPSSLVTITQLDPVYVDVTQPTATLVRLKREFASGQVRSAGDNKAATKLFLEDGSAYEIPGSLQFSEVTVDQGTGSVTLRAIFPNPDDLLLPGMFVHAAIEEGVREGAILAPQQGITHAPDGTATALVVGADDKVQKHLVQLDRAIGDQWVVTRGLTSGDRLIVAGLQKAKPGMQVTVSNIPPTNSTPANSAPALSANGAVMRAAR
jgi:membrane fusion protein (multidrug efflux system)